MTCFNPIRIRYIYNYVNLSYRYITVPCGKCHGCLSKKTSELITRLSHESYFYDNGTNGMFLTLTYNDDNLPAYNSLCKRDVQLFLKRLRRRLDKYKIKLKCSYVGEYGLKRRRPHYHLIIFGISYFNKFHQFLVRSCWTKGFSYFGTITDKSIAYCAGYMLKQGIFETGRYALNEYKSDYYNELVASGVSESEAKIRVNELKVKRSDYYRWKYGVEAPFRHWSKGLGKRYCFAFVDNLIHMDSTIPRSYVRWLYRESDYDLLYALKKKFDNYNKVKFVNFCLSNNLQPSHLTPNFLFVDDRDYLSLYNYVETSNILDSELSTVERNARINFDIYMDKLYAKKDIKPLEVA